MLPVLAHAQSQPNSDGCRGNCRDDDVYVEGGSASSAGSSSESYVDVASETTASVTNNINIETPGGVSPNAAGAGVTIIDERPDKLKIKNTPSVSAPDIYPSINCYLPRASGSLNVPGFGASLGSGKLDEGCVEREMIRIAAQMGLHHRATFMWCSQFAAERVFGSLDKCLEFAPDVEELSDALGTGFLPGAIPSIDASHERTAPLLAATHEELEQQVQQQQMVIERQDTSLELIRQQLQLAEERAQRAGREVERVEAEVERYERRRQELREYFENKERAQ